MADLTDGFSGGDSRHAITVAIYATLMYDIISATNSSPQTTEINANRRAATLMKWVHLGLVQGLLFVAIGMYLDKDRWPPLMGGGIAAVILYAQYLHALKSGTQNPGESTENVW
jgi:hypothetical protein